MAPVRPQDFVELVLERDAAKISGNVSLSFEPRKGAVGQRS